jgi:hypothetical protein
MTYTVVGTIKVSGTMEVIDLTIVAGGFVRVTRRVTSAVRTTWWEIHDLIH